MKILSVSHNSLKSVAHVVCIVLFVNVCIRIWFEVRLIYIK